MAEFTPHHARVGAQVRPAPAGAVGAAVSRRALLAAGAAALGLAACKTPPYDPADPSLKEHYRIFNETHNLRDHVMAFSVRCSDWKRVRVAKLMLARNVERMSPSLTLDLKHLIIAPEDQTWLDVIAPLSSWEVDGPVRPAHLYARVLQVVAPEDVTLEITPIRMLPITARVPLLTLTIDDGLAGANPGIDILREHGLAGSLFVEPATIGRPGYLGWERLRELSAAGWDVGGHFVETNPDGLSPPELDRVLAESRARLAGLRGSDQFAYPNGRNPRHFRHAVARHFGVAATIDGLSNTATRIDVHRIARRSLDRWTSVDTVRDHIRNAQVNGDWLVLNFHMFQQDNVPEENITPDFLRALLATAAEQGLRVLPMSQALEVIRAAPGAQVLTSLEPAPLPPPPPRRG